MTSIVKGISCAKRNSVEEARQAKAKWQAQYGALQAQYKTIENLEGQEKLEKLTLYLATEVSLW